MLFVILLKNGIFLVEVNRVVVKILDSYSILVMCCFKIVMYYGFFGECLMEKLCFWEIENKVNLNEDVNYILKYIS